MSLQNKTVRETFADLLTIDNGNQGFGSEMHTVQDGLGNNSGLSLGPNFIGLQGRLLAPGGSNGQVLTIVDGGTLGWSEKGGGISIEDLDDVNLTSVSAGQTLVFNGTNFVNQNTDLEDLGDVTISNTLNFGQVLQYAPNLGWYNDTLPLAATTGVLNVNRGGTNLDNLGGPNRLLASVSSSEMTTLAAPTASNQYLSWTGSAFSWATLPAVITNLSGLGDVSVSSPTANQVLSWNNTSSRWTNTTLNLSNTSGNLEVARLTGTIGVASGGTGLTTLTGANRLLVSTGSTALDTIAAPSTTGHVLTWNGSAIQWQAVGGSGLTASAVSAVDGSAATPSISFQNSPTSGLFRTTNGFGISANSQELITFNTNGTSTTGGLNISSNDIAVTIVAQRTGSTTIATGLNLQTRSGSGSNPAGNISILAGTSGATGTTSSPGNVSIRGGNAQAGYTGGTLQLRGGDHPSSSTSGGRIDLLGGTSTTGGDIQLIVGEGNNLGRLQIFGVQNVAQATTGTVTFARPPSGVASVTVTRWMRITVQGTDYWMPLFVAG